MNEPGNRNPCPTFDGIRNNRYTHPGKSLCMSANPVVPISKNKAPLIKGHFNRRVHVIRNPVAVPTSDAATDGTMRRKPELVADSRSTAWKNNGTLNVTADVIMAPIKLPRIRPARGLWRSRWSGMMGRATCASV
jgi:hypothetical protein